MKTQERIEKEAARLECEISERNLQKIRYEARGDEYMLRLTFMRLCELKGQLSALKWVMK